MNLSDKILITKVVLRDDHLAFKNLIERYQSDLRGLFFRLTNGNKDLVDDLAQETFIRVYKYLSNYKAKAQFKTWIFRIGYNVFFEHIKKHKKDNQVKESLNDIIKTNETNVSIDYQNALKVLNINEKAAIVLHYEKGFTHIDISKILNKPLGTVKTNILRGKEKLKKFYNYESI
jgi:RNA polymerase sigma-70 factor (ECF subfamily)